MSTDSAENSGTLYREDALTDDLAYTADLGIAIRPDSSNDVAGQKLPKEAEPFEAASDAGSQGSQSRVIAAVAPIKNFYNYIFPAGSIAASCYNLASATLGGGIISVSSGFHDSGIIVSVLLTAVVIACTIYSIRLLVVAREKTGLRTYEELARGLLGRGWDYLSAFLLFMFCWGVCIGYVISVGDMLEAFFKKPSTPEFLLTPNGKRLLTGMIWLVGMFSLSLPKQINSLRYVSFIACMFIVYFVICVIIHASQNGLKHGVRSDVQLVNSGMSAVNGFTLFIFACLNQCNVFEIYEEMRKPNPRRMTIVATITMVMIGLLNFFSGLFGYLDFGEAVTGSLLLMYAPHENIYILVAYCGICLKLCVGFAICVQPARDAIYYCLGWGKTSDVKTWVNCLVSGTIALSALILGLFVPNVEIVFSLLGGICGGFLGFLFPAYFYMYSGGFTFKKVGWLNYFGCIVLVVGGVVALVFGTAVALYSEIVG